MKKVTVGQLIIILLPYIIVIAIALLCSSCTNRVHNVYCYNDRDTAYNYLTLPDSQIQNDNEVTIPVKEGMIYTTIDGRHCIVMNRPGE